MPARFSPLAGVRVLEVTTSLAGPYCGLLLAALGADVVKVEPPGRGDDTRAWGPPFWDGESAMYLAANAGKRSLALDLRSPDGQAAVLRLAERTDVFVQNLRPGLIDRLGLGFDEVSARSPRVVYCSIGAFGRRGPRRHDPGYDPLMQAAGGIMSVTGEPEGPPLRAGVSVVDQATGMWGVIAVLAALRARDEGAAAQLVDLSLYETAVNWLPYQIAGYLASGTIPRRLGSALGIIAPYQAFPAADGWLMVAAGNDRLFAALCRELDVSELVDDSRFRTNADRVAHRDELASLLAERFRAGPWATWLARLRAAGVPAAPIQDVAEVVADEQTLALGLLQELPHPAIAGLQLVAPPISVDHDRLSYGRPPPALGEHSREVLQEAGYSEREIEGIIASDG
jgi:crotonobetainyl-CoA:carnitine CoA-transferase CaiB-like acyl-CoA transferase